MMGSGASYHRVFILKIPWRDDNAHTDASDFATFLFFVFLCSLRLNTFSFGIAWILPGYAVTWEMTHLGDRCRALVCEEAGHLPISERSGLAVSKDTRASRRKGNPA